MILKDFCRKTAICPAADRRVGNSPRHGVPSSPPAQERALTAAALVMRSAAATSRPSAKASATPRRQSSPAAKASIANAVAAGVRRPPPLLHQWNPPWRSVTPTGPRGSAHGRDQSLLRCTSSKARSSPGSESGQAAHDPRGQARPRSNRPHHRTTLIRPCRAVAANAAVAPAGHRTSGRRA